jgi:hypothetical protein
MIRKFLVAVIGMAAFAPGFSQSTSEVKADTTASTTETKPAPEEVKPTTTINGGIDFYWRYDFAKTKGNNLSALQSHNTLELGMATKAGTQDRQIRHRG